MKSFAETPEIDSSQPNSPDKSAEELYLSNYDKEREAGPYADRIGKVLNSEKFLNKLETVENGNKRGEIVGAVTEYFILHPDGFDVDWYIDQLVNQDSKYDVKTGDLLIESVMRKFPNGDSINDDLSPERVKSIYLYIYDTMVRNGFVFHGFNGAFEESIREQGLSTEKRFRSKQDLDEVADIGHAYNVNLLGLHSAYIGIDRQTSSGKVYYDTQPKFFYSYATRSPEWFDYFCTGQGKAGNTSFPRRDYESAKINIDDIIEKIKSKAEEGKDTGYRSFTPEDEKKIRDLFESSWQDLASEGVGLRVALIKRESIIQDPSFKTHEYNLRTMEYEQALERQKNLALPSVPKKPKDLLDTLLFRISGAGNEHTKHSISPENLVIVDLPSYDKVRIFEETSI
ncbi:MAG: hypothetical protein WCO09_01960 [bacterium]